MTYGCATMQSACVVSDEHQILKAIMERVGERTDNERQPALCQGHHSRVTSAHELLESIFLTRKKLSL